MSAEDRIGPALILSSPSGATFDALWRKNNVSITKKVGIFEYPKIDKTIVQDLGVIGDRIPMTFFFEGEDYDLITKEFRSAAKEPGTWEIEHPIDGLVKWQPLNFEIILDPIDSGNLTQINSNWIDPADDSLVISSPQLASNINSSVFTANESAATQFAENVQRGSSDQTQVTDGISTMTFNEKLAIENATNATVVNFEESLSPIYQGTSIEADILQVKRTINETLEAEVLNPIALAGQLQTLIQLPALVITDAKGRYDAYIKFMERGFSLSPTEFDQAGKNTVSVQEMSQNAALVAVSQIATTSVAAGELDTQGLFINTRVEAFQFADLMSDIFIAVTDNLDETQENFQDLPIDLQYFSQSESYNDIATIIILAIKYLISSAFSLLTERRFVLTRDKAAIVVCIEEYGALGDNDEIFDFFIQTNELKRDEILLIKSGREIIAYG